jgi:hypothetical protein
VACVWVAGVAQPATKARSRRQERSGTRTLGRQAGAG